MWTAWLRTLDDTAASQETNLQCTAVHRQPQSVKLCQMSLNTEHFLLFHKPQSSCTARQAPSTQIWTFPGSCLSLSHHGYCFRRPLALVSRGGPAPCSTCAQITCEQSAFRVQPVNVSMQSADSTEHTCITADCTQCALLSARTCVCLHAGLENRENPEHLMQALADIETVLSHSRSIV